MAIELVNYEKKVQETVRIFWQNRQLARQKQRATGRADQGERASVTAGKNMDGFVSLITDVIKSNGLQDAGIFQNRATLSLPGYYRPTKLWDLLIMYKRELVAVIELKSQVGPSFGNNFNNRAEEAIGTAHDFWTAYREGAFGDQPRPFLGWLMHVEDAPESRTHVRVNSQHFSIFPEFENASYLERYDILCQKLIKEGLYTTASVIASPQKAGDDGAYAELSSLTDIKTFVTSLAGHIVSVAARLG